MDLRDLAAVLFDMDGTLVTSDAAVERAWMGFAAEFGIDGAEATALGHGSPGEYTIRTLLPHLDDAAVRVATARQLELEYDDLADVTAAPGALEVLAVVADRGLPWAVVTSADSRLARARLGAAGIVPPVLITTDDIAAGKPDPAGYRRAAELLGVPASRCLVVEDAAVGIAAGRSAGAWTAGLRGLDADLSIADLHELAELLKG